MESLSYHQQLNFIKNKGIIIDDEQEAIEILSNFNYYLFMGYVYQFKNSDYKRKIYFEEVYTIYLFDKKFRNILAQTIELIEISLKTKLAYISANKIGLYGYLDANNFKDKKELKIFISKFEYLKSKNLSLIQKDKNEDVVNILLGINLFTMGMIYNFYINIAENNNPNLLIHNDNKMSIRKQLAKEYNTGDRQLESWIENILYIRNMVAHYMRIYNVKFQKTPVKCKKNHNDNYMVTNRIFDVVHIMKFLILDKKEWNHIITNIQALFEQYKEDINISLLGFPENWEDILRS